MITFVTAFIHRDGAKHTPNAYLAHFMRLANTGIPIVLFLDRISQWKSFPKNVKIIDISLSETWVGENVPDDVVLPVCRSSTDTREYMMIMNAKTEFVLRASQVNPFHTEWFAWIDFGIGHVFRDPDVTFERIRTFVPPTTPRVLVAGIWNHIPDSLFDRVCWRYAGGFFLAHVEYISKFNECVQSSILRNLPRFAWEVNMWADVERNGLPIQWFECDHNDTIIPAQETVGLPRPDPSGSHIVPVQ